MRLRGLVYRNHISDQQQAAVTMPMKLQVPDNVEKSLTGFSGRTLSSGVSWSCNLWADHRLSFIYIS